MPDSPEGYQPPTPIEKSSSEAPKWTPVPEGTQQEGGNIVNRETAQAQRDRLNNAQPVDLDALLGSTERSGPKPQFNASGEILEQPATPGSSKPDSTQ